MEKSISYIKNIIINYFNDIKLEYNSNKILLILKYILIFIILYIFYQVLYLSIKWAILEANFFTSNPNQKGAQWNHVYNNLWTLFNGNYPKNDYNRVYLLWTLILIWHGFMVYILINLDKISISLHSAYLIMAGFQIIIYIVLLGDGYYYSYIEATTLGGFLISFLLSMYSFIIAIPISLVLAKGRLMDHMKIIKNICVFIIEICRSSGPFAIFYILLFLCILLNLPIEKLILAVAATSICYGGYIAELIRGSINSIDKGQFYAASSLGMKKSESLKYVIIPQAKRTIVPGVMYMIIFSFRDTTSIGFIGVLDSFTVALHNSSLQYEPNILLTYAIFIAAFYIFCTCIMNACVNKYVKRLHRI